ncbi:tigger transposable element-derived protein 6-like [Montipora capricornis]|uniref:tigger transposable element-derived protein 6-like n=1 Tax=Montipora capricornis TaxID=246305 RepID=UPI0035F16AA3
MASDCCSRSKEVCQICRQETSYRCLQCAKPVCNRSNSCSVAASEEEPGWKPRHAVSICIPCTNSKLKPCVDERSAIPKGSNTTKAKAKQTPNGSNTRKAKAKQTCPATFQKKRKCLDISEKVKVLEFAKKNPNLGSRKLADHFGIGKTQIQAILKNKEAIMDAYASNETPNHAKRKRSSKYSDVNQAVWDWYIMCRNSNIPVSGSMLQEEATLIAEKLQTPDFVASNGWLEKFKQKYSICNKMVAGEAEAKGRRCTGGKKAKQRLTWAFFVNAEGEKEDPVVIGTSVSPRCFKNLQSPSRPYNCSYFANSKAWMNTEIMTTILSKLNRQLKRNDRHILLFMDNAPCHPQTLSGEFSNITVQFLPKNTTSKSQPLDAGIIANWKVLYRKRMLRYVCSQVDGEKNASEIVKSINVLMAIEWGRQAWNDVRQSTITKCFQKTGLYPRDEPIEDDPFEGEELANLKTIMDRIHAECSVEEYVSYGDDTAICAGLIDPSNPNWRAEVRNELLDDDPDVQFVSEDTSIDDDFDKELEEPSIKSLAEALHVTDQLRHFAQFNGYQDLALAVGKASDVISSLQLLAPKRQTALTDYFK